MSVETRSDVVVLTRAEDFLRLEADWNRLWEAGPRREVFTTFAWARAYVRAYGAGGLLIAIARRNGQASAVLPMIRQNGELRFIGVPHSDYCDLVCDRETEFAELKQLIDAVAAAGAPWKRMRFDNLSERSRFYQLLANEESHLDLPCSLRRGHKCPTVIAEDNPEHIFGDLIDKENPRRCEKRMASRGSLTCSHVTSRTELLGLLEVFFEQHRIRRGLATGSGGMFASEENRAFFRNLVEEFDPAGTLRFAVLRMNDRPVAIHFGFEMDGRYTWYVPAFDVDYWDDHPGLVLLRRLFDYACQRHLTEFDFTIGDEQYKNRFANHVAQNYVLTVYPRGFRGRIGLCRERLKHFVYARRTSARMWTKLRAFQRIVRQNGWAVGFRRMVPVFCHAESMIVFSAPRTEANTRPVVEARLSELVRHWLNHGKPTPPDTALTRIRAGHVALTLRAGKEWTALLWLAPPTADMAGLAPPPQRGYVAYDAWCAGNAESLGDLLRHVAELARRDAVSGWLYSRRDQQTVMFAAAQAGWQQAGRVGARKPDRPEDTSPSTPPSPKPLRRFRSLIHFLRNYGLHATIEHAAFRVTEYGYDRYFGIRTAVVKELSDYGIHDGRLRECRPSHHLTLRRILRALPIRPGTDVLVDIGAGSGRMVVRAAAYPFKKVVGVELVPEIAAMARENIRRARPRLRCPDVDVVAGDATAFPIPADTTIFFLNNPFGGEPLVRVFENIRASLLQNPRAHTIVSVRPPGTGEGWIGEQTWLRKTGTLTGLKGVPVFFYEVATTSSAPPPPGKHSVCLYRPYSPPAPPFRDVARAPTVVPVYTVKYRHPHHAGPSGYDRLCDYIGTEVILSRTLHVLGETILRLPAKLVSWYGGSFEYSRQDFVTEMQVCIHMLRHRKSIYHFVYGEKSFKLLAHLAGLRGHRFVATFHHPESHFPWLFKRTDHLRRLDHAVVLSNSQRDFVEKLVGEGKVTFVPYGVDTEYFRPPEAPDANRPRRCVFVGDHERDFDSLPRVVDGILDADRETEFLMIACDPRCRSFERPPRARWFSFLPDAEYLRLLQGADLLVLPLLRSAGVTAVLESLACGVPVVTNRGGVSDYLDDTCSVQCATGDTETMVRAAAELLRDNARRGAMSRAARERALLLSWPRVAAQMSELFTRVAATMPL